MNLYKGTKPTLSHASESNEMFIAKSKCVNISLGSNVEMIDNNVDLIRKRDIAGRREFVEKNPEVSLPTDLNIEVNMTDFSSLVQTSSTVISSPLKGDDASLENSCVRVTSKSLKPPTSKTVEK